MKKKIALNLSVLWNAVFGVDPDLIAEDVDVSHQVFDGAAQVL